MHLYCYKPSELTDDELVIFENLTRRDFIIGVGGLISAGALGACGAPGASAPTGIPAAAGYPRTIKDTAGVDVIIPARAQRVVCLEDMWDLDTALSLGIAPVQFGARSFVAKYTGAGDRSWKWHETAFAALGAKPARSSGDTISIEAVSAAKPDLILGMSWAMEQIRDQLAKIAPVVQLSVNWRDNLKVAGAVFASEQRAAQLIEDTDRKIKTSLQDINMGQQTIAIISCYDNTVFYGFGHPADGRADLFQRAGFTLLETISAKASAKTPTPEFSMELLPILQPANVVVLFDYGSDGSNNSGLLDNPLFKQLPAVQAGRLVVLKQGELAQGLSLISPLNIDYCLDVVRQAAKLAVKA